ncbi:MAG: PaaI family thioesterase [Candidatus Hodarchaeales archaeon]|jgi:acyl-coenzyme A thioesterase PaaI-like protein
MVVKGVQDIHGPEGTCFGCGPKNEKGLKIKSNWEGEEFVLRFNPKPEHQAFPGAINGGIIGTLFDCHANWCAATTLHKLNPEKDFPSTVTSKFEVKLKHPTPFGVELLIKAKSTEIKGNKITIEAELIANEKITAKFIGVFVAVGQDHPGFYRWD